MNFEFLSEVEDLEFQLKLERLLKNAIMKGYQIICERYERGNSINLYFCIAKPSDDVIFGIEIKVSHPTYEIKQICARKFRNLQLVTNNLNYSDLLEAL